MTGDITISDLLDNDDIFDQLIWNLIQQYDASETISQIHTLKLVNKSLYTNTNRYISRTKAAVAQKFNTYFQDSNLIDKYDIDKLVKIAHYPNEAYLNNSLSSAGYFDQFKKTVIPSFFWENSSFRIKVKVVLDKEALSSIYFGEKSHDVIDQSFLSRTLSLSQTFLHKYEIEYILSPKDEADPSIHVGSYFVSEMWSYALQKLLIEKLNQMKKFESDLRFLIDSNTSLEFSYDVPLPVNSKNPFLPLQDSTMSQMYNICIRYKNPYLASYEPNPTFLVPPNSENIQDDFVSLNKFAAVFWPPNYQMENHASFFTLDKACILGMESKLSNTFLKTLCDVYKTS